MRRGSWIGEYGCVEIRGRFPIGWTRVLFRSEKPVVEIGLDLAQRTPIGKTVYYPLYEFEMR
ncbi:MAG: hypothetical protein DWQ08_05145 [Proteobacteria bacterium]|nr:MAG: hypothetical protein DWQ08_05145 [Pseudomonadota bacterium]